MNQMLSKAEQHSMHKERQARINPQPLALIAIHKVNCTNFRYQFDQHLHTRKRWMESPQFLARVEAAEKSRIYANVSPDQHDAHLYTWWRSLRTQRLAPSVTAIIKASAEHFNVSVNDIRSSRRTANVVRPRQVAMYLAKRMTKHSLPEIGRRFGGRDHTTVLHAVKKIATLSAASEAMERNLADLRSAILFREGLIAPPIPSPMCAEI